MKRPLSVIGFTMLCSLMFLYLVNNVILTIAVCGLFALFSVILTLIRKKGKSTFLQTLCLTVVFSCALFISFQFFTYNPALKLISTKTEIKASVTDFPTVSSGRYHIMAKVRLKNSLRSAKIRLSFPMSSKFDDGLEDVIENIEVGDTVLFVGNIYKLGKSDAEVERNFESRKIFLGAYPTGKVSLSKATHKPISYYILKERQKAITQLKNGFEPGISAVAVSVLLGDKSFLDDETYQSFKDAGVSHIMAVSGLHLSIWITFIMSICTYFGLNRRRIAIFLIGFVFLVMSVSLFSGSVTRAGIMMILYLFGFIFNEKGDSLNSLGFAAIIILFINPYSCLNIGFLLSFASTLSIITLGQNILKLSEKKNGELKSKFLFKALNAVYRCIVFSFCAWLFTLPVIALFFGRISLVGVITNVLFLPVVTPMIISFGFYVMFGFVPLLNKIPMFLAKVLCSYCISVAEKISSFSFSTVSFAKDVVPLFVVASAISCIVLYFSISKKNKSDIVISVFLSASLFVSVFTFNSCFKLKNVSLTVHNVGQGLCISLESKGKKDLLVCSCDEYYTPFIASEIEKAQDAVIPDPLGSNMKLVSKLEPERIYLRKNENLIPLSFKDRVTKETDFIFGKSRIKISDDVIFIQIYDIMIAVTDKYVKNVDLIITANPDLLQYQSESVIILSSGKIYKNSISTAEYFDINVLITENSDLKIRGENSWQYLMKKS